MILGKTDTHSGGLHGQISKVLSNSVLDRGVQDVSSVRTSLSQRDPLLVKIFYVYVTHVIFFSGALCGNEAGTVYKRVEVTARRSHEGFGFGD